MSKRTIRIPMGELRKMIREEADLLQGKDHPADVSPDEMGWEEAEDVGKQDFVSQMDKPSPSVKAEARLRSLKRYYSRLRRRLGETRRRIVTFEKKLEESRRRRPRRNRRRR